jgi:hypothetical protein
MNTPTRTPLAWPAGLPRGRMRERSRFKTRTFAAAERELLAELERMNAKQCVVSSSVVDRSSQGTSGDPGVAVYFHRRDEAHVMACDTYDRASDNAYALAKTIEHLRGIERNGAASLGAQAFSAFRALPSSGKDASAPKARHWREVLGVPAEIGNRELELELAELHYKRATAKAHPDRGGTQEAMLELNGAIARAREALR